MKQVQQLRFDYFRIPNAWADTCYCVELFQELMAGHI